MTNRFPKKYVATDAPSNIVALVDQLMPILLQGDHPALQILRDQYCRIQIKDVELTGVGFFVTFAIVPGAPLTTPPNFAGGSANIKVSSAPNGAGCVLFVTDGRLSTLEVYTYGGEEWSEDATVLMVNDVEPIQPE